MKTWRRLQQIGAVPTRNSVYVLPNTDQCREDFEWIRSEIVALGGEATVFAADALNSKGDEDIVATFQRTREVDYRSLTRDAVKLLRPVQRKGRRSASGRDAWSRSVRCIRERFNAIERVDFFQASARRVAAKTLGRLEQTASGETPKQPRLDAPRLSTGALHHRRWVTRPRPGVDRMASAWLIRRFIDAKATFAFVDHPSGSDVPFDMYTGEFSHQGPLCTFETLAQRFNLTDSAVTRIGQIVHDLDMKETRYAAPEAPAVERMIDGFRELYPDDVALLEHGIGMFEALARSFATSQPVVRAAARGRKSTKGKQ